MLNELQIYTGVNLDPRLSKLVEALHDYLNLSIKGSFVLLASYGMNHIEDLSLDYKNFKAASGNGPQFRGDTDPEYNCAIDLLINHMAKISGGERISSILTDENLLSFYISQLINLADCTGVALLDGVLKEYKNGVSKSDANDFVVNVAHLILENQGEMF